MGDARKPATLAELDKKLDPANFAYISDDTYSAEEVEAQTQVRGHTQRLRGSWWCHAWRESGAGVSSCASDAMHPASLWCSPLAQHAAPGSRLTQARAPARPLCHFCCGRRPHAPDLPPPRPRTQQVIVSFVPEPLKRSPNIKMFLRSFWYRATLKGAVNPDEMHIYTLARWVGAAGKVVLAGGEGWGSGWGGGGGGRGAGLSVVGAGDEHAAALGRA